MHPRTLFWPSPGVQRMLEAWAAEDACQVIDLRDKIGSGVSSREVGEATPEPVTEVES